MAQQDNAAVVHEMYEAFNKKDFARIQDISTSSTEATLVAFDQVMKGHSALKDVWQNWAKVFPDGKVEIRRMVAMEDTVVTECVGHGTHQSTFYTPIGELQPTGKKVEIPFCDVIRVEKGKIMSMHSYFDFFTFVRQLGVESKISRAA